jgi:adenosyl cobinamide kinase/adenosyl cobinamide phosphate guanylyltransferase
VISLVLGGARSGKSEVAERLAQRRADEAGSREAGGAPVTYVATALSGAGDDDLDQRIARHRRRRPAQWSTIEVTPGDSLTTALSTAGVVLVDSLGTWLAGHEEFAVDLDGLLASLEGRRFRGEATVIVSDEVGLGVHPATPLGLQFRDALGDLNRSVAELSDNVRFVAAGRVLLLPREDA